MKTISSDYIDYLFVVISALDGLTENVKGFLTVAKELKLPVVTIVTKIDLVEKKEISQLTKEYKAYMKTLKLKKHFIHYKDFADIHWFSNNTEEAVWPILHLSNKTKKGYRLLTDLLFQLPVRKDKSLINSDEKEFHVLSWKYSEGNVFLEGFLVKGKLFKEDTVLFGPTQDGVFLCFLKQKRLS